MADGVNRRDLFRTALAGGVVLGGGAARAQKPLAGQTAEGRENPGATMPDLNAADWKPVFLDTHQDATLAALAEAIIPETDTPGAKTARVDRFLDLLLAAETRERQQAFLNSLAYIDGESLRRYSAPFVDLAPGLRNELLEALAYPGAASEWSTHAFAGDDGHGHFEDLKAWIGEAFYSSEVGMKSLGWDGQVIHGPMMGCADKKGV